MPAWVQEHLGPLPKWASPPTLPGGKHGRFCQADQRADGHRFFAVSTAAGRAVSSIPFPPYRGKEVQTQMLSPETGAQIRRYCYAEHWKIGTIARELGVHPDAVRRAIESEHFHPQALRACLTDPYLSFMRQTLDQHPRLRATRIYQMIRERGYQGSIRQLRRTVAHHGRRDRNRSCTCTRFLPNKRKPIGRTSAQLRSAVPAAACLALPLPGLNS